MIGMDIGRDRNDSIFCSECQEWEKGIKSIILTKVSSLSKMVVAYEVSEIRIVGSKENKGLELVKLS